MPSIYPSFILTGLASTSLALLSGQGALAQAHDSARSMAVMAGTQKSASKNSAANNSAANYSTANYSTANYSTAKSSKPRFDPVIKEIEGWQVHVEPALLDGEHANEGAMALKMLANHLQRISILVPDEQLEALRTVEFWVEHAHPELRGKQYHPDKGWLTKRGYDKRLAKKIHITHAAELFSRQQMLKHPAVVLHELAHGYHDQFLGFDDERILKAYDTAMQDGIYDEVLDYTGRNVRHYAATNHKEYFAEVTESYFYRNDFFPFVRGELKRHDPEMYELLIKIWGPKK